MKNSGNRSNYLRRRAANLAAGLTPSEVVLLKRLSLANVISFDFQVLIGFYIVDFVFPSKMIVVELDGSIHSETKEYDAKRDAFLSGFGFTVLRASNAEACTFDLQRIVDAPDRPGYHEAIDRADRVRVLKTQQVKRKSARGHKQPMSKAERKKRWHRSLRHITAKAIQKRSQLPKTDLTPRLVKHDRDSFPFGYNNPDDPNNQQGDS